MPYPIKVCVICSEEFELKPGKPGFANRCPECSVADEPNSATGQSEQGRDSERDEERRRVMRDLLYRKES